MKSVCRGVLPFCLALIVPCSLTSQQDYAAPVMAGISNHGKNGGDPYVTAGDRAYLIGTQDGKQSGWNFVLKGSPSNAKYYVNGSPVSATSSGIRLSGMKNNVLVVPQ